MLEQLSEEDKEILRRETTHRWHQPLTLYSLVILCSMAAAVQGVCFIDLLLERRDPLMFLTFPDGRDRD